jgi:hypothetical protein
MLLMLFKNKLPIIKKEGSLKFLNQNLMNIFLDYDTVCERSRSVRLTKTSLLKQPFLG